MATDETKNFSGRDYTTISPSAKALLWLKAETNIPFAKEAASLIGQEDEDPNIEKNTMFWARVLHFENRHWSIDQLLSDLDSKNILELSSGFSFRGLDMVRQKDVHYIDTDLPNIISLKKDLIKELNTDPQNDKGQLELLPLNALDEEQFTNIVNRFDRGQIVIVNEGLLVYLSTEEKEKLCNTIRKILKERGGYWITADIYIKKEAVGLSDLKFNDKLERFIQQHRIEENKFEDFEDARSFFEAQGFVVDREAQPDPSKLTSLNNFLQSTTPEQLAKMRKAGNMQTTWRLRLIE